MNWQLINYHVIVIDEISMISLSHSNHVFESLHSLPVFPLIILCGDKFQIQPFQTTEEETQTLSSFFENHFFLSKASTLLLTEQHRCSDQKLHSFLCLIRHCNVTNKQIVKHLSHICYTIEPEQIGADTIQHAYDTNPDTTFLTYTRNTSTHINQTLAKHIFGDVVPLTHVSLSSDPDLLQPIYKDMKVLLTENRDKEKGVIDGHSRYVQSNDFCQVQQHTYSCFSCNKRQKTNILSFHPWLFNNHLQGSGSNAISHHLAFRCSLSSHGLRLRCNVVCILFFQNEIPCTAAFFSFQSPQLNLPLFGYLFPMST